MYSVPKVSRSNREALGSFFMEKNIFHRLVLLTVLIGYGLLFTPGAVHAQANEAGKSAKIATRESEILSAQNSAYMTKKTVIKRILTKYKSPYADNSDAFVDACFKYNIDCYLLVSISGVESYFGKFIYPNSYNPFGWGGGLIMFDDWDNGIDSVSRGLKKNYIDKGYDTISKINPIYCPPNATWAGKVEFFYKQFVTEEQKLGKLNNI
jgi:hypothetical protein